MARSSDRWARLAWNAWALGFEASNVIALRMLKVAAGDAAAAAETRLMLSEKIASAVTLQTLAVTGGLGTTAHGAVAHTLSHYRRKVRANRRRLQKP